MKISRFVMVAPLMASLLILQNCDPKGDGCEGHEPVYTYYHINETDKNNIPFTGTDTLVYVSSDGDTATLYGQGKKVFNEKQSVKWNPDPACSDYDYNYLEHIEYMFISNRSTLKEIVFSAYVDNDKNEMALMSLNQLFVNNGYRLRYINAELRYTDSIDLNNVTYFGFTIYSGETKFLYNYKYGFLSLYLDSKTWKLILVH